MSQIFLVSSDRAGLVERLSFLNDAGYPASGATTFEEAIRLLADRSPDLVIADERLGAFNGLHVILRARARRADVSAIVTTPARNPGLEADASGLGVECLVTPRSSADWLAAISRSLDPDAAIHARGELVEPRASFAAHPSSTA